MRKSGWAACACVLGLAGCGSSSTVTQTIVEKSPPAGRSSGEANLRTIPALQGKRLDVAEELAKEARVPYKIIGGGLFGVIVTSDWTVCEQSPPAGALAARVKLVIARSC
jgi:hypothetical protein